VPERRHARGLVDTSVVIDLDRVTVQSLPREVAISANGPDVRTACSAQRRHSILSPSTRKPRGRTGACMPPWLVPVARHAGEGWRTSSSPPRPCRRGSPCTRATQRISRTSRRSQPSYRSTCTLRGDPPPSPLTFRDSRHTSAAAQSTSRSPTSGRCSTLACLSASSSVHQRSSDLS